MDSSITHRTPDNGATDAESRRHALDLLLSRRSVGVLEEPAPPDPISS